jgi:hypothetical protein
LLPGKGFFGITPPGLQLAGFHYVRMAASSERLASPRARCGFAVE